MPIDCAKSPGGGKGNAGMFYEREPRICAAGLITAQPEVTVASCLQHYLLKDEADAFIGDAIKPERIPPPLPPLRHPIPLDMRYAGPFGEVAQLINPPIQTKFQTLVSDFKDSTYTSYWKKNIGQVPDSVPMLPAGFDAMATTFGKKTPYHGCLYDIVMPKDPPPENIPQSKRAGVPLDRKYRTPPFNPELTYGYRTFVDKRGTYAKTCMTDDRKVLGTAGRVTLSSIQANYQEQNQARTGTGKEPNENILNVQQDHVFGIQNPPDKKPEYLMTCEINPDKYFFGKCMAHLNLLRKRLSKRFLPTFFYSFYLNLKHYDNEKTGWLPRITVYEFCASKLIRFDSSLIEPLLKLWNAFDGSNIEYKTFVRVINYREPSPALPKIPDVPDECLEFKTTYKEMVRPGQDEDLRPRAGIPSGRYIDLDYPITPDGYCKADRVCLPQESDMRSCLNPSVLTLMNVSHRDMYAIREPDVVRKVFEAAGEEFTDDKFNAIWKEAQKYHSQGKVCYETFRRALKDSSSQLEADDSKK